jgi:hypothetical protein
VQAERRKKEFTRFLSRGAAYIQSEAIAQKATFCNGIKNGYLPNAQFFIYSQYEKESYITDHHAGILHRSTAGR